MIKHIATLSVLLTLTGCTSINYDKTGADGVRVSWRAVSLFSNSTLKGAVVEGQTKTTTTGMRLTGAVTEPNPESITVTGDALGSMIGQAVKTAVKP